jgi:hypothetical protein
LSSKALPGWARKQCSGVSSNRRRSWHARARGTELERELAFGVVQQLFEPVLANASSVEHDDLLKRDDLLKGAAGSRRKPSVCPAHRGGRSKSPPRGPTVVPGASRPVLAVCKPGLRPSAAHRGRRCAQADAPSLRYLAFLLPRIEELPVALAVATRPHVPADGRGMLEAITGPGRRRHPGSGSSAEVRPSDGARWDLRGSFDGTGARGFAPQPGGSEPLSGENARVAEHLLASEPAADAWSVDRLVEAAWAAVGVRLDRNLSRFIVHTSPLDRSRRSQPPDSPMARDPRDLLPSRRGRYEAGSRWWLSRIVRPAWTRSPSAPGHLNTRDGESTPNVAWVIGLDLAQLLVSGQAAPALVGRLREHGADNVVARIHSDHLASAAVSNPRRPPTHRRGSRQRQVWRTPDSGA